MFGDGDLLLYDGEVVHSFLLIGQSNMAGRGDMDDVAPIRNRLCYTLRMGRWQPMTEPINHDRSIFQGKFRSGIGLSASFADAFTKKFSSPCGLIPCADGGTNIDQWARGDVLFDHAVMMTKLAQRTSRLSGILWHQGESDCRSDESVDAYYDKLMRFVTGIRDELGAQDIPFIFGELSDNIGSEWGIVERVPTMNEVMRRAQRNIPNSALVSVKGLALKNDGIHFNSASYRELGVRYFDAYLDVLRRSGTDV